MDLVIMLSSSINVILQGVDLKQHVFANRVFIVMLYLKEFLRDERISIINRIFASTKINSS